MRRPGHPCQKPGCRALVDRGRFCKEHQQPRPPRAGALMSNGATWKKLSRDFLAAHSWCADPQRLHPIQQRRATITGHKIAHKGDPTLFWDYANLLPLCLTCNSEQAVRCEGALGRPVPKAGAVKTTPHSRILRTPGQGLIAGPDHARTVP